MEPQHSCAVTRAYHGQLAGLLGKAKNDDFQDISTTWWSKSNCKQFYVGLNQTHTSAKPVTCKKCNNSDDDQLPTCTSNQLIIATYHYLYLPLATFLLLPFYRHLFTITFFITASAKFKPFYYCYSYHYLSSIVTPVIITILLLLFLSLLVYYYYSYHHFIYHYLCCYRLSIITIPIIHYLSCRQYGSAMRHRLHKPHRDSIPGRRGKRRKHSLPTTMHLLPLRNDDLTTKQVKGSMTIIPEMHWPGFDSHFSNDVS